MDYLKLFQSHADYEAFVSGGTMVRPNVSHCVQENEVHYNPIPIMTVKYNVTNASNPTQLYTYTSEEGVTIDGALMFDKVVIDGNEVSIADLDAASGQTQFSAGEHTVKYTLKDPTFIGLEQNTEQFPPTVTKIGAAFRQCTSIVSVKIPNSVTTIDGAFFNCSGLTSVTIPNSVSTIINGAFGNCGLTSIGPVGSGSDIELPNSVTTIGNVSFANCSSLTSLTIPNSVTSVGLFAFQNCSSLTNIVIPNSVTSVGEHAFEGCSSLTNVTIPNSVTTIDSFAFYQCSGLTSVTIGNSVMDIGVATFGKCGNLTNITSLAMTAPTITSTTFNEIKYNGTLTVPSGSSGYDVWMGTGYYYLGYYNWTKVEQ